MQSFLSKCEKDTFEIAERLSKKVEAGAIILLMGDLGAGKTAFAKGFASGLGITDDVVSPTFTIMNAYDNTLYHFDLYRLSSYDEFLSAGCEEFLYAGGYSLVEWPEKVGVDNFPSDVIIVKIEKLGESERKIIIEGFEI